ncbi:MAG: DUF6798 domain-containing protein [Pirellulales bacterium]
MPAHHSTPEPSGTAVAVRPAEGAVARRQGLLETAAIFLMFCLHAGWAAPDVNEAHYLGKAKHYWDASFAQGDFFFESADAHEVFYRACGWLTLFLSLPAVAWMGRLATWWLLAWSFRRLSAAIVPQAWLSVVAAALFLALSESCHMAGEWVIGGFEAKGFAYVLVFLALEALVRGYWARSLWLLGAASSFHVLVGGWTVVGMAFMWLFVGREGRPSAKELTLGLAGGLLLALPGIWPALRLEWGVDHALADKANEIYVYQRLRHHLTPTGFEPDQTLRHLTLIVVWFVLCALTPYQPGTRRFRLLVTGCMLTGFVGMGVWYATKSDPALAARLMRYYWFRMGDSLLPVGVGILAMSHMAYARQWLVGWGSMLLGAAIAIGGTHLSGYAIQRATLPAIPRGDRPGKVRDYHGWRDACEWIANSPDIPADARFITPRMAQTFKWHTGRAEVASWKDLPQDAVSIVEWWRRMKLLHWSSPNPDDPEGRWLSSLTDRTPQELRLLGEQFSAQFLLTESGEPLELPLLYSNDWYAVYDLR